MATRRRLRFVRAQVAWMLAAVLALALLDALSYEAVFLLSLVGFCLLLALTDPIRVRPRWRSRLAWLLAAALLVAAALAVRHLLAVVGAV